MEKITAEVFVPAVNKKYDVLLPDSMKVGAVAVLSANLVSEQEQIAIQTKNLVLGIMDTGKILEDDISVSTAGITDGTTLILL